MQINNKENHCDADLQLYLERSPYQCFPIKLAKFFRAVFHRTPPDYCF